MRGVAGSLVCVGAAVGSYLRSPRKIGAPILLLLMQACSGSNGSGDEQGGAPDRDLAYERVRMVEVQLAGRGIRDEGVLEAMRNVRRHRFAPGLDPARAYEDRPHPIGHGQTISQPYIVGLMSEAAHLRPPCRVLEVGTGSGYQAAVLAEVGCTVYTIEIVEAVEGDPCEGRLRRAGARPRRRRLLRLARSRTLRCRDRDGGGAPVAGRTAGTVDRRRTAGDSGGRCLASARSASTHRGGLPEERTQRRPIRSDDGRNPSRSLSTCRFAESVRPVIIALFRSGTRSVSNQ